LKGDPGRDKEAFDEEKRKEIVRNFHSNSILNMGY
jgi:hypothetical protein